ncbi:hypothetical protein Tco_0867108, partial [Tanacetum coccineum]
LIWRNKEEIVTISLDYLYNKLKIYEPELAGSSSTSQNPQNVVFVSSNSTNSNCNNSTNEAGNTAYGVSAAYTKCNPTSRDNLSDAMICAFLASQPNSPQLAQELKMTVPSTAEEKTAKKNDVKARSLLLMALPNEHQLTFDQYVDAQSMFAAIKARFGGNEATKKTQKALLKEQYENFNASSSESLDSIFNRLQKLVS